MSTLDAVRERLDMTWERLAPRFSAAWERLVPVVASARRRLEPVVAAAQERLAPVVEPVVERVREAAAEFGEIAVGSVPDAEVVADPVGELRDFFGIEDTEVLGLDDEDELTEPPRESWALSTLESR